MLLFSLVFGVPSDGVHYSRMVRVFWSRKG